MTRAGRPRRGGMRQVAQLAGVSVSTVANVLNNPRLVAADTRRRVQEVMTEVGFVRSGPARQLRGLPSQLVGVVTLDQGNPFYAVLNRGIEDGLADAGCVTLTCSTDVRPETEARVLRLLEEQAVRGILITPNSPDVGGILDVSRRGTPVVLVDGPEDCDSVCSVTIDHRLGGQLVAAHLIALGHRRLAYVRTAVEAVPAIDRLDGFRAALRTAGLDPATALVEVRTSPAARLVEDADRIVDELLDRADPPTAIACANDLAAVGVIRGLVRRGRRVPGDVSVVGYDDLDFAALLHPALTSVRTPVRELGRAAARMLLDEGGDDHHHAEVRFEPTLAVRDSTGPP
ncbi:LacI family DNA-binding transcriptional regulator [Luedemannella helvata]|uniref:LacI family DNA-binding transcriptional regulator n=1 Tax=Luedemannella helvata TaxID=349315 RepID=A0ABN2KKD0_9ACTN